LQFFIRRGGRSSIAGKWGWNRFRPRLAPLRFGSCPAEQGEERRRKGFSKLQAERTNTRVTELDPTIGSRRRHSGTTSDSSNRRRRQKFLGRAPSRNDLQYGDARASHWVSAAFEKLEP